MNRNLSKEDRLRVGAAVGDRRKCICQFQVADALCQTAECCRELSLIHISLRNVLRALYPGETAANANGQAHRFYKDLTYDCLLYTSRCV